MPATRLIARSAEARQQEASAHAGAGLIPPAAALSGAMAEVHGFGHALQADLRGQLAGLRDAQGRWQVPRGILTQGIATIRSRAHDVLHATLPDIEAGPLSSAFTAAGLHGLVRALFDHVDQDVYGTPNPSAGEALALLAVGGTARGDMAPWSDIDLLFVTPYKLTARVEQVVEGVLYALWDLDCKVGHAVRSVDDCLRLARTDMEIRTNLLETRYLGGDPALYAELTARLESEVFTQGEPAFIAAKLAERDARHTRMGDSRYVLEPNVKDGKGGLRDLHALYWIAKHIYRLDRPTELVDRGVLEPAELAAFEQAEAFLLSVRCALHDLRGRAEERLTFDVQPRLARLFGHEDDDPNRAVEAFMRRYFAAAKDVGDLTRIIAATLEADHRKPSGFGGLAMAWAAPWLKRDIEGFALDGGRLTIARADQFASCPADMIRIFEVAQKRDLDIHPAALRAASRCLDLIDDAVREDADANACFLSILTSRRNPEIALRRMSEAGVLGRFLPPFGRVIAQMQFDMYHVYTTDEHTLQAIGLLHRLETGRLADRLPLASAVMSRVHSRTALYAGLLLHDIAKGSGKDHSLEGQEIAEQLCLRFGMSKEESETAAWLVRHHLLLSHVAQKRDLADPLVIDRLADHIQSPERLRLLLVITCMDINAVGPGRWTDWTASLLETLYGRVMARLEGESDAHDYAERVQAAIGRVRDLLPESEHEPFTRFAELAPRIYWLSFPEAEIVRHVRHVVEAGETTNVAVRTDRERGVTTVLVYTPDQPALAARIAGALAACRAEILEARLATFTNGFALDSFLVQAPEGPDVKRFSARIRKTVLGVLEDPASLPARLAALPPALPERASAVFRPPARVIIDNSLGSVHTVIEVNALDRPGLLHDLAASLSELGLRIGSAKVATYGEKAVDVFYVKNRAGLKIEDPTALEHIRTTLLETAERDRTA